METSLHSQLVATVQKLIHAGYHYDLDGLAALYTPDLRIVMVQPDGTLACFDYAQNMAFFKNLRDSGATLLNTAALFKLAEVQEGIGHVLVERTMNLGNGEQRIVFSLMLRETGGQWQVFREHAVVCGKA